MQQVRLERFHQPAHPAGVEEIAQPAQPLEPIDVVHLRALDLGRTEGDDVHLPVGAGEVLHPAPGVDVGRIGQIDNAHATHECTAQECEGLGTPRRDTDTEVHLSLAAPPPSIALSSSPGVTNSVLSYPR